MPKPPFPPTHALPSLSSHIAQRETSVNTSTASTELPHENTDLSLGSPPPSTNGHLPKGKLTDQVKLPDHILVVQEMVNVLIAWFSREVKVHIQTIDKKVDELVIFSKAKPREKSRFGKRRTSVCSRASCDSTANESVFAPQDSVDVSSWGNRGTNRSDVQSSRIPEACVWTVYDAERPEKEISYLGVDASTASELGERLQTFGHMNTTKKIRDLKHTLGDYNGHFHVKVWRFLENPYSSWPARVYSALFTLFVIFSVFVSFWQSVDKCPLNGTHGELLQMFFDASFAAELLVRYAVCPDRKTFGRGLYNIIDFVSTWPLVFRLVVVVISLSGDSHSAEELLSKFALVPVLRLLKLMRRFEKLQLLVSAFLIAIEALPVLLFTVFCIALFFAALISFAEPKENIDNLPMALWFVLVTMTTVGYGDITPITPVGKIATSVLFFISCLYMAMPIGIVGSAFSQVWGARDRLLLMHRLRHAFLEQGFSEKAMQDIITMFAGADGELGLQQFQKMLTAMHMNISDERVQMLMDSLDDDGSGTINVEELMNGLFPQDFDSYYTNLTQVTSRPTVTSFTTSRASMGAGQQNSASSKSWNVSLTSPPYN